MAVYKTRSMIQLTLILTPHGALALTRADDGGVLETARRSVRPEHDLNMILRKVTVCGRSAVALAEVFGVDLLEG